MTDAPERIWAEKVFWPNVEKTAGCWIWTSSTLGRGYGAVQPSKGRSRTGAHRFSWALHNGRWPSDGLVVMHSCDNPICVNPDHLSEGTHSDNAIDCVAKGRHVPFRPIKKDKCRHGHEYSESNTEFAMSRGLQVRRCKQCKKEAQTKWEKKQ